MEVCVQLLPGSTDSMPRENPNPPPAELLAGLGERLREERARLKLTQFGLADKLGISGRAVQHYELGNSTIRLDILYKMRDVGIDIDFLLFGGRRDVAYDPVIWEQVNRWADHACRDRRGNPFPEPIRQQRVLRAYDHVVRGRTPEEVAERLEQLQFWRVA